MLNILEQPRYAEMPIKLFFENYILYVLRLLPEEVSEEIQKLELHKQLKTDSTEWYNAIPEALGLSKTMEVAIWDRWIDTYQNYITEQRDFKEFAMDFTDDYLQTDSSLDRWTAETYAAAAKKVNNFIKDLTTKQPRACQAL